MVRNILVLTDNLPVCASVNTVLSERSRGRFNWTIAVGPGTDTGAFAQTTGREVEQLDLRQAGVTDSIRSSYDLVLSAHSKQIFPKSLVSSVRCINLHPGYNPINRGWFPQVFALCHDLPIGATIHEMDEKVDHGNVIARAYVDKSAVDTSLSLYERVLKKEIELFSGCLESILSGSYASHPIESVGNVFSKKDFERLCALDLDETLTARELINRLRALTHGDYANAYFRDPETGRKVFVKIELTMEAATGD